jgi:hypothetical protein
MLRPYKLHNVRQTAHYPLLSARTISPRRGLLPYINRYALSSLAASSSPPMKLKANTPVLTASCQAGTPTEPSRIMVITGALKGKMLKATQTGLFGSNKSTESYQNGKMLNRP